MGRAENLAIMFVDMAGYAQRTARQSRDQNKRLLRDFNALLMPLILRFGGKRIKSIGDAMLVTFRSPTDSVRCGMAMHDAVGHYNASKDVDDVIQIRVALNVGEVRLEHDDIFGEAVNIAARVEELTPPGEIYLTGVVYLSMNKAEVPAEHIGEHMLKGIPEPVRLFRVPSRKIARLQQHADTMDPAPGELPYGGMHVLPTDSDLIERASDAIRRARYADWAAKVRAIPARHVAIALGALGLGLATGVGGYYVLRYEPPLAIAAPAEATTVALPAPAPAPVSEEARALLREANTAFFNRRRLDAAQLYTRVLDLEPRLRHDSGLAANLVGTLGWAGDLPGATIRKYPSPEMVYELGRRTGQPGRKGAQRAAGILKDLGQESRIDQRGMAATELAEAPTCEERLEAVRRLRALRDPRALPALRESLAGNIFSTMFRKDRNECLRREAQVAIDELEKLTPASRS